jgi:hypothetical protein
MDRAIALSVERDVSGIILSRGRHWTFLYRINCEGSVSHYPMLAREQAACVMLIIKTRCWVMSSQGHSPEFSWLPYVLAAWLAIDLAFIFVGGEGLWWRL